MADASAPSPPPPPADAGDGEPLSPSSSSAPRELPSTLLFPLPPPSRSRGAPRAAAAAAGSGERGGRRKAVSPAQEPQGTGGSGTDRLAKAVRMIGKDVDAAVAGADILDLAMAKGPMFLWVSHWPEEGYPKENHPY